MSVCEAELKTDVPSRFVSLSCVWGRRHSPDQTEVIRDGDKHKTVI